MPPFQHLNKDTLYFIIHHVILPPRVPQKEEDDIKLKNFELLEFLSEVASEYTSFSSHSPASIKAKKLLELTTGIHEPAADFPQRLRDTILNLEGGDFFALHVFMQNAGIIFRRLEDCLQFEVFEASPVPEAVVGCRGRLKCKFPGPATSIPWEVAKDPAFLRELGSFLHHMNTEQFDTLSKSRNGGNDLSDTRNVANPRYIIELFTGIMRGIGKEFVPNSIWKSLRDEVNWKSALNPWRRSGLWLVVRVALQTVLGYDEYKKFLLETVRVILDQASRLEIDSYSLSCTSRKLARRASKIGETNIPRSLLERILRTAEKANNMLSSRWQTEISHSKRMIEWNTDLNTPANIAGNTHLQLRNASSWVEERIKAYRSPAEITLVVKDPQEKKRHIAPDSPPTLSEGAEIEVAISLIDFENWIKENLENWCSVVSVNNQADVINFLSTNIKQYHVKASQAYVNQNILDTSRMALTIMEMWVRLDKIICEQEPLLLHYSPELPIQLLEPALFIQKEDMERLLRIESYLRDRHSTAERSDRSSVFGREICATSFAIYYYNQSIGLQTLKSDIIRRAEAARDQKRREHKQLNEQHAKLMEDARRLSCDYRVNEEGFPYHWHLCRKCSLKNQATNMRIKVEEWPLPTGENEIKMVIFELQPPENFVTWRDITYYIMVNVCKTANGSPADFYDFNNWDILASIKPNSYSRVRWASETKPFSRSHYSEIKVTADESEVLLKHAGRYRPLDAEKTEWIESRHKTCSLAPLCASNLSNAPYEAVSYAVNQTTHPHNKVIAEQHKCPASLTLHEYEAFASLRSGDRIQWHNILTELRKDDLTFKDESVFTLVLHAACHAGAVTDGLDWRRDSHLTLSEEEFSRELLKSLLQALSVLEDNWEQANTLKLLILLARRLVTAGHWSVKLDAIRFLKKARNLCNPWIESIQSKLKVAFEPDLVQNIQYWLLRVLGIQCSTFDIDQGLLHYIFDLPEDIVQFLVCQISVHDSCLGILSTLPHDLGFLLEANRRFAVTAESYVHERIRQDPSILFSVLQRVLPTQPLGTWCQLGQPADRWWRLSPDGCDGSQATVVHLNILQGKVLVNGKPNGRLPEDYFTHESYVKLFGNRMFDVFPSQLPNMSYQTKNKIYGAILHFHLEGRNLVIRKQNGEDYEFIPAEKFLDEIPSPLVRHGSQWLNLNQEKVIFYQSDRWWTAGSSECDWVLSRNGGFWTMERGFNKLLDIDGNIHATAHIALQAIEARDFLVATTNQGTGISIDLPRYKLKFFLNESNLFECENLKGWVVDRRQDLGTFIGLRNFLKLRSSSDNLKECFLVPFGSIQPGLSKTGNHSVLEIHHVDDARTYTIYYIDRFLGQVRDDGTLRARYTRIYLHALTSGIIEDPLTGRTGVSESLELLKNAASFSFQELYDDDAEILNNIARLTPPRNFYPDHLRKMQTVGWNGRIPTWVQHDGFYAAVRDIFDDWNRRQFLVEGSKEYDVAKIGSTDLLERGRNISSIFTPGDPHASSRHSVAILHDPRNVVSDRETCTQDIARASFEWQEKQHLDTNFDSLLMEKPRLDGCLSHLALEYSPEWFGIPPSDLWCTLYELCRQATKEHRFGLLFVFSHFVYEDPNNQQLLKSLLAVATNTTFNDLPIPPYRSFKLGIGTKPKITDIQSFIRPSSLLYEQSQYYIWSQQSHETDVEWYQRRYSAYENDLQHQVEHAAHEILDQWPTPSVTCPNSGNYTLLNLSSAMDDITRIFQTCFQNLKLSSHLTEVVARLRHLKDDTVILRSFGYSTMIHFQEPTCQPLPSREYAPTLKELLKERLAPEDLEMETTRPYSLTHDEIETDDNMGFRRLDSLARSLKNSDQRFTKQYANDLLESIRALKKFGLTRGLKEVPVALLVLQGHRRLAAENVGKLMSSISHILSPKTKVQQLQKKSGLWPDVTKLQLLRRLRQAERRELPREWISAIIVLGEAITWDQRASRLVDLACEGSVQEFDREVRNPGRQNWNAEEYIDWLLLELDSEMLIRPIQASIGFSMMDNSKMSNAVMQLNMGEGKSAVIVPAVAVALADTKRLVRIIVLKPLSAQMFHILVQRLSGLCDRRVYFLPFWRNMNLSRDGIDTIRNFYESCMESGAIILTLPDHILSFKLMGIEKTIQEQQEISEPLVACQEWVSKNCRDILDESDEILHIRYQLIYTMGDQLTLEGGRNRWVLIQEVLGLVQEKAIEFFARYPMGLEVGSAKGLKYRPIQVIDTVIGEQMLQDVASDICKNGGSKVLSLSSKFKFLRSEEKKLFLKFISVKDISMEEQNAVFDVCESLRTPLLILRGLIADGVLLFILRDKRYRVDYGLDRERSGLAVPYRAKDRPAVRAEFGHPEVVLALTCLTYYYGGLQNEDLQICFDLLRKTDNPGLTYEYWIKCYSDIPPSLSKLQGINFLDEEHVKNEVFPFFRYNKSIIDFFLSEFIFPREAKGFSHKLSTNAWDLAEQKDHNTTGFSGTNDNKYLLPTSIQQSNLPQQIHTNSLVLKNILLPENDIVLKADKDNTKLEANGILAMIAKLAPKIRVLLDVGAQMLELDNREVARTWLEIDQSSEIHGALFFGEDDQLLVMKRDGMVELLVSSGLSKQLDRVLVFLDEAHTRYSLLPDRLQKIKPVTDFGEVIHSGVDLRLPVGSRAAVTLGPNLVKDKLVQGCMRMRKLGNGHSLVFLASPEIYQSIQNSATKPNELIDTFDVLLWTMLESCRQIQHGFSVWANQGFQYFTRKVGWEIFRQNGRKDQLKETAMETEARPLIDMYGIGNRVQRFPQGLIPSGNSEAIFQRLDQFGVDPSHEISVEEEQEREVDQEMEEERNIERPAPAKPREHFLHPDIFTLATRGILNKTSDAFSLAYKQYERTSARSLLECEAWTPNLYATVDFMETVELEDSSKMDGYLRPVRWILSTLDCSNLILLSPYEANELVPSIRKFKSCRLHCYSPRVAKAMPTFEFLDFCPIPSLPNALRYSKPSLNIRMALNVFAGQLFFQDEQYYLEFCKHLGIFYGEIDSNQERNIDGWIDQKTRQTLNFEKEEDSISKFSRSPLPFLTEIVNMRRKGQGFFLTHLGSLLDARVLETNDF